MADDLNLENTDNQNISQNPQKPGPNFFRITFFISLFIFVGIVGIIVYTLAKPTVFIPADNSSVSITPTAAVEDKKCSLNDKKYNINESFPAADGCNICTCASDLSITCTEKTCTATPTATTSAVPKDWKTYTNSTYSYSVKYSNNWNLQPQSIYKNETSFKVPEINCEYNIFCYIDFNDYQKSNQYEVINSSSLSDYLTSSNKNWKLISKTTTANQTSYEVTSVDMAKATSFFIENNQKSFCRIDLCSKKTLLDNQFISSFKFN